MLNVLSLTAVKSSFVAKYCIYQVPLQKYYAETLIVQKLE